MKKPLIFLAALCGLLPVSANAHVTANPNTGTGGAYFQTDFRISHGCDGSATVAVSIKIPAGIVVLKPQAKPGWTIEIKKSKLEKPVPAGHGKTATEQFDEIIWRGGPLEDAYYDEFGIVVKLPDESKTLWFPVTQTCEQGEHKWTEIPEGTQQWRDLKSPAPFVTVTKDTDHSGHKH